MATWAFLVKFPSYGTVTLMDSVPGPENVISDIVNAGIVYGDFHRHAQDPPLPGGTSGYPYASGEWFGLVNGYPTLKLYDARFPESSGIRRASGSGVNVTVTATQQVPLTVCCQVAYVLDWKYIVGVSTIRLYIDAVLVAEQVIANIPQGLSAQDGFMKTSASTTIGTSRDTDMPVTNVTFDLQAATYSYNVFSVSDLIVLQHAWETGNWNLGTLAWHFQDLENTSLRDLNGGVVFTAHGDIDIVAPCYETASESASPSASGTEAPPVPPLPPGTPPPTPPGGPCSDTPQGGGGPGHPGCTPPGDGWVPCYSGPFGTIPEHPDVVNGELLTGKPTVDLWLALHHHHYPAQSPNLTIHRKALVDLAHDGAYYGGWKQSGLLNVGDVEHGLGNERGGFEAATVDLTFSEAVTRWIREIVDDDDIDGDELEVYLASPTAAANADPPRVIARAVIQGAQLQSVVQSTLTAVDSLFSIYGPFGRRPTWPYRTIGEWFPEAPQDVRSRVFPIIAGEKSDRAAIDPITGLVSERGLCPGHFVGYPHLMDPIDPDAPGIPVITAGSIVGNGGSTSWTFVITALMVPESGNVFDKTGEGFPSDPFTVDNAPSHAALSIDGYISLSGTYDLNGTQGLRLYVLIGDVYYHLDDAEMNLDGTWFFHWGERNGQTDVDNWELASPPNPSPYANDWAFLVFGHGALYKYCQVFGSDLGNQEPETPHNRVLLDIDARADILVPGYAAWPFAETYIDFQNTDGEIIRLSGIFVRGPLLLDHLAGTVNITANIIGVEDVGDGTGLPLMGAHLVQHWWLENHLLNGYLSGLYTTDVNYPQWPDGTPKVRSSRFVDRQDWTLGEFLTSPISIESIGLRAGWYVDTPRPLTEWFRMWNFSTETQLGINGHGQLTLGYRDPNVIIATTPLIDHITDIYGPVRITIGSDRENVCSGVCDWDPDTSRFRVGPLTVTSDTGIARYKGIRKQGELLESTILNVEAQWLWVLGLRLARLQYGIASVDIIGTTGLLDYDVDDPGFLRLTTIDGPGASGYVERPMQILRRRFSVNTRLVTLSLIDAGLYLSVEE